MPVNVEAKIADVLLGWTALMQTNPPLPVAYPNVEFTEPSDKRYLVATPMPGRTDNMVLGDNGTNDHSGMIQISVFWPSGDGVIKPAEIAGQVMTHWHKGVNIPAKDGVKVRIEEPAWAATPLQESDRLQIPVTVPYRVFVKDE